MALREVEKTHFKALHSFKEKNVRAMEIKREPSRKEPCRPAFKNLNLFTLPCLYIPDTSNYFKQKAIPQELIDIRSHETGGRELGDTGRWFKRLPPTRAGIPFDC